MKIVLCVRSPRNGFNNPIVNPNGTLCAVDTYKEACAAMAYMPIKAKTIEVTDEVFNNLEIDYYKVAPKLEVIRNLASQLGDNISQRIECDLVEVGDMLTDDGRIVIPDDESDDDYDEDEDEDMIY